MLVQDNGLISIWIKEERLVQYQADTCLYMKQVGAEFIIIALYFDDLLLACNSNKLLQEKKEAMKQHFCMKDLGKAHYLLGIQIKHNRAAKKMLLHQSTYLSNLLQKHIECRIADQRQHHKLQA